ncbi:MAG: alpha/beta hydrolase [Opitutaceae bacterium]|jgi:acetyl esterase/lipase
MKNRIFLVCIAAFFLTAAAQAEPVGGVKPAAVLLNQSYTDAPGPTGPGDRQALDLYLPEGEGPFPLIVWIHGGGWQLGDRRINFAPIFNRAGFAVASIGYRLTKEGHPFPAQIEDCIAGLAWLKKHAGEHRIDPDRVGLIGHSAGAHLAALMLACGQSGIFSRQLVRADAAVLWSPPVDLALARGRWPATSAFSNPRDPFQTKFFPTGAYDERFAIYASPTTYVGAGLPPMLIVHHERDTLVPIGQTEEFVKLARAAGDDVVFHHDTRDLKNPHAIISAELYDEAIAFFRQKLGAAAK